LWDDKKIVGIPTYNIRFDPLKHLLEIKTWGTSLKSNWQNSGMGIMVWVNAKMDKESHSIMRQSVNISKDDMEDYNLAMSTHAMDFFKKHASLKKPILNHFFTSFLNNLSTNNLLTHGNLLSTKSMNSDNDFMQLQLGEHGFHKNWRTKS
jgi:hypothetical protein